MFIQVNFLKLMLLHIFCASYFDLFRTEKSKCRVSIFLHHRSNNFIRRLFRLWITSRWRCWILKPCIIARSPSPEYITMLFYGFSGFGLRERNKFYMWFWVVSDVPVHFWQIWFLTKAVALLQPATCVSEGRWSGAAPVAKRKVIHNQ